MHTHNVEIVYIFPGSFGVHYSARVFYIVLAPHFSITCHEISLSQEKNMHLSAITSNPGEARKLMCYLIWAR